MPYIKQESRENIDAELEIPYALTSGELNYVLTKIILEHFLDIRAEGDGQPLCYDDYNTAIGVLECVKLELYRRMVAPYEDTKIKENGDVY